MARHTRGSHPLRRNGTFGRRRWDGQFEPVEGLTDPQGLRTDGGDYTEAWGTPGESFWTPEAVRELREVYPEIVGKPFTNIFALEDAALKALERSWDEGGAAHALAPSKDALWHLRKRAPVYRLLAADAPFRFGYAPVLRWNLGQVLAVPARDDSDIEREREWRSPGHEFVAGEDVYLLAPSAQWSALGQDPTPAGKVIRVETSPDLTERIVYVESRRGDTMDFSEEVVLRRADLPESLFSPPITRLPPRQMDTNLTLAPRKVEALSAASLRAPKKGRLPSKALAVVGNYSNQLRVALVDPKVLRTKQVAPNDILGYVSARLDGTRDAEVSVAAAEPGYGYLLYAVMSRYASTQGATGLVGSSVRTRFADAFWDKQPNGRLLPLSDAEFRHQFGTTYTKLAKGGEALLDALTGTDAGSHASVEAKRTDSRTRLHRLGSAYFDDYYSVSSEVSRYTVKEEVARPVSPRAGAAAISRVRASLRNLALVPIDKNKFYLLTVPRGATNLGPENMITRVQKGGNEPGFSPMTVERYVELPLKAEVDVLLRSLPSGQSVSAADRRILQRMVERGDAVKTALTAAGIAPARHEEFLSYLFKAMRQYYERSKSPDPSDVMAFAANPRRFPSSIRIFMPV